mmetsp:Transcript_21789/g.61657  ORF Transcript_21789/g.61657 Transcript_21789/m.61657 type:complete len:521 (+) Transcript_21789:1043-2605(+)
MHAHVPVVGHLEVSVRHDAVHRLDQACRPGFNQAGEHHQRRVHDLCGELPWEVEEARHVAAGPDDFLSQPIHVADEGRAAHAPAGAAQQHGAHERRRGDARHTVDLLEGEVGHGLQQHRAISRVDSRIEPRSRPAAPLQRHVLHDEGLGAEAGGDAHVDVPVAAARHLQEVLCLLHDAAEALLALLGTQQLRHVGPGLHDAVVVHRHRHDVRVLHSPGEDRVQQHAKHTDLGLQELAASTAPPLGEELEIHATAEHALQVGRDHGRVEVVLRSFKSSSDEEGAAATEEGPGEGQVEILAGRDRWGPQAEAINDGLQHKVVDVALVARQEDHAPALFVRTLAQLGQILELLALEDDAAPQAPEHQLHGEVRRPEVRVRHPGAQLLADLAHSLLDRRWRRPVARDIPGCLDQRLHLGVLDDVLFQDAPIHAKTEVLARPGQLMRDLEVVGLLLVEHVDVLVDALRGRSHRQAAADAGGGAGAGAERLERSLRHLGRHGERSGARARGAGSDGVARLAVRGLA